MDHIFWHNKWRDNQLGFHQTTTNNHLLAHWGEVGVAAQGRVLVPLCGKSLDMLHLHQLGHEVIGVELSPIACAAFFEENGLRCDRRALGHFEALHGLGEASGLTLLCGDFTTLDSATVGLFDGFFDRAALIAMPPSMRPAHVGTIARVLRDEGSGLLTTVQYPQDEKAGPPFSVPPSEVQTHFGQRFSVSHLKQVDSSESGRKRWQLSSLLEHVFICRPQSAVMQSKVTRRYRGNATHEPD